MGYIKGTARKQQTLLPEILDEYIAEENPARVIDAYINSLSLEELGIKASPSATGRPPYNPQDMLKLYIYGYFNRIRSSRRLETETARNVELMWLMQKLTPDHKTIARFRKDNAKGLKNVFRNFVQLCKALNLYGRELVGIDGSKFEAVNATDNNFNQAKLKDRIRRIDEKLEKYLSELNENDKQETDNPRHTKEEIVAIIGELSTRKQTYEDLKTHLEETGETQISTTDPDAKRMKTAQGASDIFYNVQSAVDAKHNLVADFDVTNHCNDKNLLAPMAKSVKEILGVEEMEVVADASYFVASDIAECIANGITPHVSSDQESITISLPSTEEESNTAKEFTNKGKPIYVKERNIGICPMGTILYPRSYSKGHGAAIYSNAKACKNCPHRKRCPSYYDRELRVKMPRSEFSKEYNDEGLHTKQINIKPDKEKLRQRKSIVEHPFGTIKRGMDTTHCLLKGIDNVRGEFALTFLAYNLKRVINILGAPRLLEAIMA